VNFYDKAWDLYRRKRRVIVWLFLAYIVGMSLPILLHIILVMLGLMYCSIWGVYKSQELAKYVEQLKNRMEELKS